jgi:pyridoxamine 5'-phosphate oxidase
MDLTNVREEYQLDSLDESKLSLNPFDQFRSWFKNYLSTVPKDSNAMTLATLGEDGFPKSRIVLLKELTDEGFVFFTNYKSAKGRELAKHPQAALNFFWSVQERQIRIEGWVEKIDEQSSTAYFNRRPYLSKIGALASEQSAVIENRLALEEKFKLIQNEYPEDATVVRPKHWGGYVLKPHKFEFWQGRSGRLHDRIEYIREGVQWKLQRLQP